MRQRALPISAARADGHTCGHSRGRPVGTPGAGAPLLAMVYHKQSLRHGIHNMTELHRVATFTYVMHEMAKHLPSRRRSLKGQQLWCAQTPPIGEEGSVAGGREEAEGGTTMRSAPSAPATQFPSQEGPNAQASVRGKVLWSRHVTRMTLAHALMRHLRGEPGEGRFDEDDEDEDEAFADISACEQLLESYFAQVRPQERGCGRRFAYGVSWRASVSCCVLAPVSLFSVRLGCSPTLVITHFAHLTTPKP